MVLRARSSSRRLELANIFLSIPPRVDNFEMREEPGIRRRLVLRGELQCLIFLKRFSRRATCWGHRLNCYFFLYKKVGIAVVLSFAGSRDILCKAPPSFALAETRV